MNLLYVHSTTMGYGRMGTNIAREVEAQGVTVYDRLQGAREDTTPSAGRREGRANVACWLSVPTHAPGWWVDQIPTLFTMWEGMRLPEAFRETLHRFDTVIVPSEHNVELFSAYHNNVRYVPLGIDPEVWHYEPRQPSDRHFRFLIGGSGVRKGTDLAFEAFTKLWGRDGSWGDGPIPMLMMKNPRGEPFYHPRVQMIAGRISDEEEVDLYRMAHCYLQPSRGEGFGLQPLQAIAQGLPTILTDAHGHRAFSDLGIPIGSTEEKAAYFIYGNAGTWWEPNLDDLMFWMQDVYDNYTTHLERARLFSAQATHKFTWANTAHGLLDAIGRDRLTPYTGREEWFAVDQLKFKVVTNRDWPCEIAGIQMFFTRGQEYWQLADVKRILFEAGVLDPRCLDDDDPEASGLTDEQIARAGKYRAQYSNCPTCGRALE